MIGERNLLMTISCVGRRLRKEKKRRGKEKGENQGVANFLASVLALPLKFTVPMYVTPRSIFI